MRFLARLLGRSAPASPRPLGSASVYYRADRIAVFSVHRDLTPWSGPADPMVALPGDVGAAALGAAVLEALSASRQDMPAGHVDRCLPRVFELTGEKGWRQLEKRWSLIHVWIDAGTGVASLMATRRHRGGGYVHDSTTPTSECALAAEALGVAIRRIIDGCDQ